MLDVDSLIPLDVMKVVYLLHVLSYHDSPLIRLIIADCLLAGTRQQAVGSICLTYACCCMYSLELLMMDGKNVRNM